MRSRMDFFGAGDVRPYLLQFGANGCCVEYFCFFFFYSRLGVCAKMTKKKQIKIAKESGNEPSTTYSNEIANDTMRCEIIVTLCHIFM